MKKVVNSSMVVHLWANQSQAEAHNAQRSIFFTGDTIYSYGTHFPIARIVPGVRINEDTVLLTTKTYSVTTSRHVAMVRSAIRHKNVIECNSPLATTRQNHEYNLCTMRRECYASLDLALHARIYTQMHIITAEHYVSQHLAYRTLFGLDLDEPLFIAEDWKISAQGRIKAQALLAKEHAAQDAREAALRLEHKRADLEDWKINKDIIYHSFYDLPIALRPMYDNENILRTIQTSLGAEVPATHAKRLWKKVNAVRASGVPYRHNEHTEYAGEFKVNSIDAEGTLNAGCHTIEFAAMAELANKLGW